MNTQAIRMILWKDYRSYRSLWLALLGATFALECLSYLYLLWQNQSDDMLVSFIWWTVAMPICFAICVTSVSMSQEREIGTLDWLRAMPLSWRSVLAGKSLFAVLGTVTLFAALSALLLVWLLPVSVAPPTGGSTLWGELKTVWRSLEAWHVAAYFALLLLGMLTGTLCSLVFSQPLLAAVVCALVLLVFEVLLAGLRDLGLQAVITAATSALVAGFVVLIARKMFEGSGTRFDWSSVFPASSVTVTRSRGTLRRFGWQQIRAARALYLLILMPTMVMILMLLADQPNQGDSGGFGLLWFCLVGGWLGLLAFQADVGQQGYRFLTERGVAPLRIWVARQVVGVLCLALPVWGASLCWSGVPNLTVPQRGLMLLAPVLAYVFGQFLIVACRSTVVAASLTVVISVIAVPLCFMLGAIGIPAWIVVGLPACSLWAASAWAVRAWTDDREGWPERSVPVGISAFGFVVTLLSLIGFRVLEIPRVDNAAWTAVQRASASQVPAPSDNKLSRYVALAIEVRDELASQAERDETVLGVVDTEDTSERAGLDDLPLWKPALGDTDALVDSATLDRLLDEVLAVRNADTERPSAGSLASSRDDSEFWAVGVLGETLLTRAQQLQSAGELTAAWQYYQAAWDLAHALQATDVGVWWFKGCGLEKSLCELLVGWAAAEGQTDESMQELRRLATENSARTSTFQRVLVRSLVEGSQMIQRAPRSLEGNWDSNDIERITFLLRLMPWERTRAARLYDHLAVTHLQRAEDYVTRLSHDDGVLPSVRVYDSPYWLFWSGGPTSDRTHTWIRNTSLVGALSPSFVWMFDVDASLHNRRRALVWQIELIDQRRRRGDYPETIDALEVAVDELPKEVYLGRPFLYRWSSGDAQLVVRSEVLPEFATQSHYRWLRYPPGSPFLWSPGRFVDCHVISRDLPQSVAAYSLERDNPLIRSLMLSDSAEQGWSTADQIWSAGQMFGLPSVAD